jgi:peroxiredoxin
MIRRCSANFLAQCLAVAAWAGNPADDWQAVTALDRGPQVQARSVEEARSAAAGHLDRQEKALRGFIAMHPQDEHAFEARLRLVRLLDIRAGFQGSEMARVEARQMLDALEKSATPEQRAEIEFAKVTRLMRGAQKAPVAARTQLLSAARKFQADHPGDRRVAALLTEVATLFDGQPRVKTELLTDASALATEPGLKVRIADDLRRTDLLGTPIKLNFTSLQGKEFSIEEYRGRLVLVVFFADFSPPSTEALARIQKAIAALPKGSVAAIGVNLDPTREAAQAALKAAGVNWPVAFDGKSWSGELVRSFGINALPTVWLLDKQGKLRSLNALEGTADQVRQVLSD